MNSSAPSPVALTIAGSDSGGGAGLQADLKVWEAQGVFGASVVTCVTAQNTCEVRAVDVISADRVCLQMDAVFDDLDVVAVKTGLLPTPAMVEEVAASLQRRRARPLVVDPVLVATSGDALARDGVAAALVDSLFPLATLVTPNLDEARALTGRRVETLADMRDAARDLVGRGARAVLVKGGHLPGAAVDVLLDEGGFEEFAAPRIDVGSVHGTGCALSAAIAGGFARGRPGREAVGAAKRLLSRGLENVTSVGRGARVLRFSA